MASFAVFDGLSLDTIFLMVKKRLTKLAQAWMARLADVEAVLKGFWLMKNWRSRRMKGRWSVSMPPLKYSPSLRRNNNVVQARKLMAC